MFDVAMAWAFAVVLVMLGIGMLILTAAMTEATRRQNTLMERVIGALLALLCLSGAGLCAVGALACLSAAF